MTRTTLIRWTCWLIALGACSDDGSEANPVTNAGGGGAQATAGQGGSGPAGSGAAGAPARGGSRAGAGAGAGGSDEDDAGATTPDAGGANAAADGGAVGDAGASGDGTDPTAVNPYPGYTSDIYSMDSMWMCKPGLTQNYCLQDMEEATEALPDGTFQPYSDQLSDDHPVDCIFWYPTVNRTEDPTSLDFSDPTPMLSPIRSQAARFSRVCNVYAPFYRQVSLNNGGDRELGYSDAVESFKHYIANWNQGRNFVVYGHSQGTGHATRLIQEHIDETPELRDRLISTLLIGGGLAADTFANIPLCTSPDQFGCAVGYRTYGAPTPPTGTAVSATLACTNPAALGGGPAISKGAFFVSRGSTYAPDLGTDFTAPWGLFRDFFSAECVAAPSGGQYLRIDYANAAGDMRDQFLDLSREIGGGLHVFDYNVILDDLVELVGKQAAAKAAAKP
jgi:Protein of unknown function (DUF3089)